MQNNQRKRVIYISGPYRDPRGEYYVNQNILAAREYALFVWRYGGVALCPHLNTALFGGAYGIEDSVWLEGDIELIRRCDAVWAIDGWKDSVGSKTEIRAANVLEIPVLFSEREVLDYIRGAS